MLFDVSFRIRFESTWRETSFSPRENDNLKIDRESNGESKGEGRYWKERGFIGGKRKERKASGRVCANKLNAKITIGS